MKRCLVCVLVALSFMVSVAGAQEKEGIELTIYNQNFALVKDKRMLELKNGVNNIRFSDVAAQIEPTSVHFKSLTDPLGCMIQEQNYEYDLVSADKLLKKYIDKSVNLVAKEGKSYSGSLMSYDGEHIVLSSSGALSMISRKDNIREISFPDLPEGLITKPTLMWQLANNKAGAHLTEVSYLTQGIGWEADYVLVTDKDDKSVDLSGWVTIDNKCGASFKDASLKLIAGEVKRAQEETGMPRRAMKMVYEDVASVPQFSEQSFFEYHLYTLQRKATVKDNQTKQISLLSANSVPVKKLFIFDPVDYYGWYWYQYDDQQGKKEQKVKVKLELKNSKDNKLGMPLPKGKVKVYKKDSEGSLQFIGEDSIDHTPKDETIRLYLGDAFDVVGERKKINYRQGNDWAEESFEISLRNHKESAIEVNVVERMWRHANWKIIAQSHQFTKKDAQAIEFKVPVAKDAETKITYTVRYWW
ncbi:MAG: DUF4139 domain-containing protein [Candidatus Omnitrophica bacterium]|nr:DUF4139 domain-containing protein [Candidatus Omnitrophota bacterium]